MPRHGTVDVSRETRLAVFGDQLDRATAYAAILVTDGVTQGLIGPREADRIWGRHLVNCAVVAPALPAAGLVVDVGSGAGLPGVVLAILCPGVTVRLVEPMLRRAAFLEAVTTTLDLPNVSVQRERAERLGPVDADMVTARAVAPLSRLVGWCLPALRPGGSLLALKGAKAADELEGATAELVRSGAASWRLETYGSGLLDPPTRVVRVVRGGGPEAGSGRRNRSGHRRV